MIKSVEMWLDHQRKVREVWAVTETIRTFNDLAELDPRPT
jgi:hypothetical protein